MLGQGRRELARLVRKPNVRDLFGIKGRRWLGGLELPEAERETVDGWLRHLDFCDREIAAIEKVVAAEALARAEIRRLMTVPGVNVITAATFIAAVGEIDRFPNQKKLVGYLGLDEGGASARPRRLRGRRGPAAATS